MSDRFTQYFHSLKDKRIAVLGLGVSNRPLVRLLLDFGCQVTGCDKTPREKLDGEVLELEKAGCTLHVGENYLDGVEADVVFRTPGMHPANPAIQALVSLGAQVTSEMEVFFEVCPCTILAVTGSDGKTTTTTLVSEMLKAEGKTVWLGGNIGTPLLPLVRQMQPSDFAVVELSSFQLMDMKRSPARAVITNLAPNHLDIHKDMAEYVQAKTNIFRYQDENGILILNADNPITAAFRGNGKTLFFSRQKEADVCLVDGVICRHGEKVLKTSEILIPGVHNVENYMAAIAMVDGLVSDETIRQVARTFGGVEHRLELVRELRGVKYINDSIGTSPTRTAAGLHALKTKPIVIAGGYDMHIPFDGLGDELCLHAKRVYLTGDTAEKIRDAVFASKFYKPDTPDVQLIDDFTEAVLTAASSAEAGDIVLLSPACAAFDRFKNFAQRGEYFKKLIMELE